MTSANGARKPLRVSYGVGERPSDKAGPFLPFVNDLRNIIEHAKPNKRIDI